MRVLVACECSGAVREAFRARGHDAWSCDLLPATDGSPFHQQLDARLCIDGQWDLLIAHPPCDYLTNSAAWAFTNGPYHQQVKPETLVGAQRRQARVAAAEFFLQLWNAPIPRVCIENPIGYMNTHGARFPNPIKLPRPQIIQPHQFGDDASKATCLWLRRLPPLVPTGDFPPRIVEHQGKIVRRWSNQTDGGQNKLTPSDDRSSIRAVTYLGIAKAMAEQWGHG